MLLYLINSNFTSLTLDFQADALTKIDTLSLKEFLTLQFRVLKHAMQASGQFEMMTIAENTFNIAVNLKKRVYYYISYPISDKFRIHGLSE